MSVSAGDCKDVGQNHSPFVDPFKVKNVLRVHWET